MFLGCYFLVIVSRSLFLGCYFLVIVSRLLFLGYYSVHPRKRRVVLSQLPHVLWASGCWHYERTLYSRRPLKGTGVSIYLSALRRVKVIVEEAKAARLEASLKKKEIRDGKRKDPSDVRATSSRKKTRPDEGEPLIVEDTPGQDVVSKRGKKKTSDDSPFLELEKIPKRSMHGPPDKSVGNMLMDMELFKNKYQRVWIFGEGVNGYVSIDNIERGDAGYNCRPISEAHLKEMKTWLFNYAFIPKIHPNFLTIVPSDRRTKPFSFEEVKDKSFHVVNGQHTLVACLEYVNDPSNTDEVKRFFSKWPCNVVWAPEGDDDPLFHLSGVLNLDSEYRKHFRSFTECIQHARKTWIRRGRPDLNCTREVQQHGGF